MRKKIGIAGFVLTLVLIVSLIPATVFAGDYSSEWGMFRKDKENSGQSSSKTARVAGEAVKKWSHNLDPKAQWSPVGSPIIVGGNIYIASDDDLNVFDKSGKIIRTGKLKSKIGYTANIAYGDGKIFVPLDGGQVQALDAGTLKSLWISEPMPEANYQNGSNITYHDGYIYTGTYLAAGSSTDGFYFALSTNDEDSGDENEEKAYAWNHTSSAISNAKGFYGVGGAVYSDVIIFAGDDGILVSKDLKSGTEKDTYDLGGQVRSSVMLSGNTAYIATKGGRVYSVPLAGNGTFKDSEVKYCNTSSGESTSSPVIHAGKLYAVSGSFDSGGKVDVIDAGNMSKIGSADLGGFSQSSPLKVDGYSASSNGNTIYIYLMLNDSPDDLVVIENSDSMSAPKVSKIFSPGGEYSMSSVIADSSGTMYFLGNSGTLYAVGYQDLPKEPESSDPKPTSQTAEKDPAAKDKQKTGETKGQGTSPDTSDTKSVVSWIILILASLFVIVSAWFIRKRNMVKANEKNN